jgi:hypothetical protein
MEQDPPQPGRLTNWFTLKLNVSVDSRIHQNRGFKELTELMLNAFQEITGLLDLNNSPDY